MGRIVKDFPTLYGKQKTGAVKQWVIHVEDNEDGTASIVLTYGQVGGKQQTPKPKIVKAGKNIGKINETTPVQQAVAEAQSKWEKQLKKNYVLEEHGVGNRLLPMLAETYKKTNQKYRIYPAWAQPKLNGVRCLATVGDNEVIYTSRTGDEYFEFAYHDPWILAMFEPGVILDGEMYLHHTPFETITALARRSKGDRSEFGDLRLQYHLYDIILPDESITFEYRYQKLMNAFLEMPEEVIVEPENILEAPQKLYWDSCTLKLVETLRVDSEQEFILWHDRWAEDLYEGAMFRNPDGVYTMQFRVTDLLKYKNFVDEEFDIVGATEGTGKDAGTVIFLVEMDDNSGRSFSVRPQGSHELRTRYLREIDSLIGKPLTVRYQNRSKDNIPIFPVGVAIRDYE